MPLGVATISNSEPEPEGSDWEPDFEWDPENATPTRLSLKGLSRAEIQARSAEKAAQKLKAAKEKQRKAEEAEKVKKAKIKEAERQKRIKEKRKQLAKQKLKEAERQKRAKEKRKQLAQQVKLGEKAKACLCKMLAT